jgi:hypothetical protein
MTLFKKDSKGDIVIMGHSKVCGYISLLVRMCQRTGFVEIDENIPGFAVIPHDHCLIECAWYYLKDVEIDNSKDCQEATNMNRKEIESILNNKGKNNGTRNNLQI